MENTYLEILPIEILYEILFNLDVCGVFNVLGKYPDYILSKSILKRDYSSCIDIPLLFKKDLSKIKWQNYDKFFKQSSFFLFDINEILYNRFFSHSITLERKKIFIFEYLNDIGIYYQYRMVAGDTDLPTYHEQNRSKLTESYLKISHTYVKYETGVELSLNLSIHNRYVFKKTIKPKIADIIISKEEAYTLLFYFHKDSPFFDLILSENDNKNRI